MPCVLDCPCFQVSGPRGTSQSLRQTLRPTLTSKYPWLIATEEGPLSLSIPLTAEGNGNPLQYSCLGNPMDGGAWQAAVQGVAKSQTGLSDSTTTTISFRSIHGFTDAFNG